MGAQPGGTVDWHSGPARHYAPRVFGRRQRIWLTERDQMIEDLLAGVPGPIAERVLAALMLPPDERAELIGRLHANQETRSLAALLIDFEEDRALALDLAHALKDQR